jgi:hypothetical protein
MPALPMRRVPETEPVVLEVALPLHVIVQRADVVL